MEQEQLNTAADSVVAPVEDHDTMETDAALPAADAPAPARGRLAWLTRPRLWVAALAAFVLVRGLLWLAVVPPWQGPDEPGHFEYIGLIDRLGRIPSLRPNVEIVPELTIAINDSAYEQRFEQFHPGTNIHFNSAQDPPWMTGPREAGYQRPTYYLLALPIYQALNGHSILTQYYAVALLSVLLGVTTVLASVGAVHAVLPGNPWALAAVPLLVAFWPTQSHMLTRITNDNLATAAAALAFWMGALVLRNGLRPLPSLGLAGALVLAAYAKGTSLFVLGFGLCVVAYGLARMAPRFGPRVVDVTLLALGVTGLIAAVLAWREPAIAERLLALTEHLPDGNRVQGFLQSALRTIAQGQHLQPERLAVNADQALFTLRSFWAVFGWGRYLLPDPWYRVAAGAAVLALAGWGWLAWRARRAAMGWNAWHWRTLALFAAAIPMALLPLAARMIFDPYDVAFHGRVLQTLLIPVTTLLVVGWQQWLPPRWQAGAPITLVLLLLLLDAVIFTQVLLPRFYS
jgi:hypothetical protein